MKGEDGEREDGARSEGREGQGVVEMRMEKGRRKSHGGRLWKEVGKFGVTLGRAVI